MYYSLEKVLFLWRSEFVPYVIIRKQSNAL